MPPKRNDDEEDESSTSSDDTNPCQELTKKFSKGMKEALKKIFIHERSFIYDENGPAWGEGPSPKQRRDFLLFLTDPNRLVFGSASESNASAAVAKAILQENALLQNNLSDQTDLR